MDHRDIGFEHDPHQAAGHRAGDFLRMGGLALPDDSESEDGRIALGAGQALNLERNFERPGNTDDGEIVAAQGRLRRRDEAIHIFPVEQARHHGETETGGTGHKSDAGKEQGNEGLTCHAARREQEESSIPK
jgi:hypothetical protein